MQAISKGRRTWILVSLLSLLGLAAVSRAESHGSTVGRVSSIKLNDLSETRYLPDFEKRYACVVRLDALPDFILGLPADGDGGFSPLHREMLLCLRNALENGWYVAVRWSSSVVGAKGSLPPHAKILSLTVSNRELQKPEEPKRKVRRIGQTLRR